MRNRNKRKWHFLTWSEAMPGMARLGGSEDRLSDGDAEEAAGEGHHGNGGGGVHKAGSEDGDEDGDCGSVVGGDTATGQWDVLVSVGGDCSEESGPWLSFLLLAVVAAPEGEKVLGRWAGGLSSSSGVVLSSVVVTVPLDTCRAVVAELSSSSGLDWWLGLGLAAVVPD